MAFKRYKHLNVPDSWERYFTKYPQGMSILESLFEWVSQVDSMVDNVNSWNEYLYNFVATFDKELQQTVTDTLTDWQNSGFLDVVISESLQWQLDDYITTNEQDKLSLTTQLQETNDLKADKAVVEKQLVETKAHVETQLAPIKKTIIMVEDYPRTPLETDDSGRVQRAVNDLQEDAKLLFAPIEYTFSKPVVIDEQNIIIDGNNAVIRVNGNFAAFESYSETRVKHLNSSLTRLIIENFNIKGLNKVGTGISVTGIARGSSFKNLKFSGLDVGLFITGSWSFFIESCFFTDLNTGILTGDQTHGLHNGSDAVNAYTVRNSYFTEIKTKDFLGKAINAIGTGTNISIIGNTCELNNNGFIFLKSTSVHIKDNYFESITPGISSSKGFAIIFGGAATSENIENWSITGNLFAMSSIKLFRATRGEYYSNRQEGTLGRMIMFHTDSSGVNGNRFVGLNKNYLFDTTNAPLYTQNTIVSGDNTVNKDNPILPLNGWTNYEESVRGVLRYTQTTDGYVHIEGSVKGGTTGLNTPVGNIDVFARPKYLSWHICSDIAGKPIPVSIGTDGNIVVRAATTDAVEIHIIYKNGSH